MTKEKMLSIAKRNVEKAEKSLLFNRNRKGVTEVEIQHLSDKVEYAKAVYNLIKGSM